MRFVTVECSSLSTLENVLGYIESMENYFNNELFFDKLLNITKIGTGAALSKTIERQAIFQVADTRHAIKSIVIKLINDNGLIHALEKF